MGREIRRVPADWEHPTQRCEHSPWAGGCSYALAHNGRCFHPLFNRDYETEAREWLDKAIAWDNGTDLDCAKHKATHPFYWEWADNPPDKNYYRPKWTSEPTHYQVYETVSEGTPVTPHFATKEELVEWLVQNGDEWDQARTREGKQTHASWDRQNAEEFVQREWTPYLLIISGVAYLPKYGIPAAVSEKRHE